MTREELIITDDIAILHPLPSRLKAKFESTVAALHEVVRTVVYLKIAF